ncbi:heat shock 70 kDa protein 14-like isoform X2 [Centruroides vittatus]|uniref:heat shock 70 kDa protein 14-like isoform X2 n=1 Tax=Centruroides vittatus TaxID=120091 RepID=UPI00350EB25D
MTTFGLYFGTTNTCLAACKDGNLKVLANDAGDRVTPAIVSFAGGEKNIGLPAKLHLSRNAQVTICCIKQLLINEDSIDVDKIETECKIVNENGLKYEIEEGGKIQYYSPQDVLLLIFQKLLEIAKSHSDGEEEYCTVLTVPLHTSKNQKRMIRDIAVKAGFKILRIISEPSAALLAYTITQKPLNIVCHYLIYRAGGTSVDVTVIAVVNGLYQVLSYVRKNSIGGNHFTNELVEYCIQEFLRQYKVNIKESKRSVYKLHSAAETCKNILTNMTSAQCSVESLYDGIDFTVNIGRGRFESLINNKLQECIEPIQDALGKAKLNKEDIHKVILVGGTSKTPRLVQIISNMFSSAEILNSISSDEAIALGAAAEAALLVSEDKLEFETEPESEIETLSETIYMKDPNNDGLIPLISKSTPIPAKQEKIFTLSNLQNFIHLKFYEGPVGCSTNSNELKLLAKLILKEVPNNAEVIVNTLIKTDGSVHLTCTEKTLNKSESILIGGT